MHAQGGEPLNEDTILEFSGDFVKFGWSWKNLIGKTSSFLQVLVLVTVQNSLRIVKYTWDQQLLVGKRETSKLPRPESPRFLNIFVLYFIFSWVQLKGCYITFVLLPRIRCIPTSFLVAMSTNFDVIIYSTVFTWKSRISWKKLTLLAFSLINPIKTVKCFLICKRIFV